MFWQLRMLPFFHFLVFRKINPSNRTFQRSEHVKITKREVRTVSRMFQKFKFQILDVSIIFLSLCCRVLSCCKITVCDDCPFRFVPIAASVRRLKGHSNVHCFTFRLAVFKFRPLLFPKQCQHDFRCR